MNESHIRRTFDAQLDSVHTAVVELGEGVCSAVREATRVLLDHDLDGARHIIDDDDTFDAATIGVEEACCQLLALEGPMAGDLRAVIAALRVASELERCGDLATNIAKCSRRIYDVELDPKLRGMIDRMGEMAAAQLRFAVEAYDDADEGRAAALDDLDDEIDELHRTFLEEIFASQASGAGQARMSVQLALLGRFYERLGDHAVNIGERVRYQVSGWTPEHDGANRARVRRGEPVSAVGSAAGSVVERGVVVSEEVERRRVEALRRDFVANIGHELRTPVGALVVLAETLRDEVSRLDGVDGTSTVARLGDRLTHEATRLGHTIDDLLELSRIEAGEPLVPTALSVTELVDAAVDRTRPAAEVAGVTVEVTDAADDARLSGDRRQIVSALTNLVDNAVKYSDRGGTVEVHTTREDDRVRFVVRDYGIGIPSADQVRIFERFHRVDRARRRDTGGTGLGLSIVRHVALNHGGTVEVASVEGEGAAFTLSLPADRSVDESTDPTGAT